MVSWYLNPATLRHLIIILIVNYIFFFSRYGKQFLQWLNDLPGEVPLLKFFGGKNVTYQSYSHVYSVLCFPMICSGPGFGYKQLACVIQNKSIFPQRILSCLYSYNASKGNSDEYPQGGKSNALCMCLGKKEILPV